MDDRRARFLEQLRETFRVEAAEHIELVSAGLVALERASEAERAPLLEQVFREAHSLKGAARAVGLVRAEVLCAELESLFAAAKGDGLRLTPEHLDGAHASLAELAVICADPSGDAATAATAATAPAPARPAQPAAALLSEAAEARPTVPRAASSKDTIRVAVPRLTGLMRDTEQLVGLRLSATSLAEDLRQLAETMATSHDADSSADHVRALSALAATAARDAQVLAASTDLILEGARSVLLLPCSALLGTMGSVAREMARQLGKDVELRVDGEDIEVDRRVLDELKDPLIHLLRNAVDHGIELPQIRRDLGKPERAMIVITVAAVQANRVRLTIADDGAGIDAKRVIAAATRLGIAPGTALADGSDMDATTLIFESGLSSSQVVTDLSGRGLGLAIVREKVHKLNGTISVTTSPGRGTSFHLEVPLSLSNYRGVMVSVAGRLAIIPSASVVRVFRVPSEAIASVDGRPSVTMDNHPVLLAPLHELLDLPGPDQRVQPATRSIVGVHAGERRIALLVDEVRGEQDVILKQLGPLLARVPAIAGVSMGARGEIIPVLDAADLVERAFGRRTAGQQSASPAAAAAHGARRLLVADDSITSRSLLRSLLAGEGYVVTTAVDGEEALSRLHTEAFDLVVSDVDMPRMTGLELTEAIRADALLASLPVILVTSLATPEDRRRGLEAGASAFVAKGNFDSGNLLDIVRRFL